MASSRANLLGWSIAYWGCGGMLLGAAFGSLLLAGSLVADELELFGPRYGSPSFDAGSLLVLALVSAVGGFVGAIFGGLVGLVLGIVNGLLIVGLTGSSSHGLDQKRHQRIVQLLCAVIGMLLAPLMFQLLSHAINLGIEGAGVLGINVSFWVAGLIPGLASWWASGRVIREPKAGVPDER